MELLQWVASFDGPSAFLATLLNCFSIVYCSLFLAVWKINALLVLFNSNYISLTKYLNDCIIQHLISVSF